MQYRTPHLLTMTALAPCSFQETKKRANPKQRWKIVELVSKTMNYAEKNNPVPFDPINQLHRSRGCDSAGGTRDSYANRQRTRLTAVTGTPIIPLFDTISMPMPPITWWTLAQICIMLERPQLILGRAPIFIAPSGKRGAASLGVIHREQVVLVSQKDEHRKPLMRLHEHTALEQTYVIEGSLEDHEGKCGPGQFVWRPAGNQHEHVASSVQTVQTNQPDHAYGDEILNFWYCARAPLAANALDT
jgi:ChrR Cupin-like domain